MSLVLVLVQLLALIALDNQRTDVSNSANSGGNLIIEVFLGIGIALTIALAGFSIYKLLSKKTKVFSDESEDIEKPEDSENPENSEKPEDSENPEDSDVNLNETKSQSPIKRDQNQQQNQQPIQQQNQYQTQQPIQYQNQQQNQYHTQYQIAPEKISNKISSRSLSDVKKQNYLNTLNSSIGSNYN